MMDYSETQIKELENKISETEERIMDVADASAASTDLRFTHDEVFGSIREKINA